MERKKRIFIIGDSHTDAIRKALKRHGGGNGFEISALRFAKLKDGKEIGDLSLETVEEVVSNLDEDDLLVSTTGGNQHQVFGLIQHPVAFDFHEPNHFSVMHEVIPYNALWDVFEMGIRGKDGELLRRLRRAAKCRFWHLAPPPPKESEAHILQRFETHFANQGIADKGITPSLIRLKLWMLQCRVLERVCSELDIGLLPPPQQGQTPEGFLAHEFYANDATHANEAYGELVLQQLEGMLHDTPVLSEGVSFVGQASSL